MNQVANFIYLTSTKDDEIWVLAYNVAPEVKEAVWLREVFDIRDFI